MTARRVAIAMAGGLALAGCSSPTAEVLAPTESPKPVVVATPAPSPAAMTASREAKLAVTRCTDALTAIGTPLATYLDSEQANADAQEWAHGLLEDAVTEAQDSCDEAMTQLGVDGMSAQALTISRRLASGDMIALRLAVHLGGFEGLDDAAEYFGIFGPVRDWSRDLKQSVGI